MKHIMQLMKEAGVSLAKADAALRNIIAESSLPPEEIISLIQTNPSFTWFQKRLLISEIKKQMRNR